MTERASFVLNREDIPAAQSIMLKLATLGYSERLVGNRLGLKDLTDLQWRASPVYRSERLLNRDPLALAIDLFLLQGSLPGNELGQLFSQSECETFRRCGLLEVDDTGRTRARASLFPAGTRLIFSDHAWPALPHPGYPTAPHDHVMSVGRDSRNLLNCVPRRKFSSALDLCTGSGIHALLATRHTQHVLAVDINPRAAQCTRFNTQISGAANLEVVVGDLFDPVGNGRFDLITANPPFVPSPLNNLTFRDGGPSGEDVQKRIVAGLPHHLAPGGIAQIVTELGERDREPLTHRLREWLNGAPMDIYMLRLGEHSALKYAIGHSKGDDYQDVLDSTLEWSRNLQSQGYVRMVSLLISFQWSDVRCGSPWSRIDQSPPPHRTAGAEIDAAFLSERSTRIGGWPDILHRSSLRLAGPIALLDAHVAGRDLRAKTTATLLGQALTIKHQLDHVEREILNQVEEKGHIPAIDLLKIFHERAVHLPSVLEATRTLLRYNLVRIDGCEVSAQ
jgi:SAM-dependent methyltransferase